MPILVGIFFPKVSFQNNVIFLYIHTHIHALYKNKLLQISIVGDFLTFTRRLVCGFHVVLIQGEVTIHIAMGFNQDVR